MNMGHTQIPVASFMSPTNDIIVSMGRKLLNAHFVINPPCISIKEPLCVGQQQKTYLKNQ